MDSHGSTLIFEKVTTEHRSMYVYGFSLTYKLNTLLFQDTPYVLSFDLSRPTSRWILRPVRDTSFYDLSFIESDSTMIHGTVPATVYDLGSNG